MSDAAKNNSQSQMRATSSKIDVPIIISPPNDDSPRSFKENPTNQMEFPNVL